MNETDSNEKATEQRNGDVKLLMQTLKETDRMPPFSYSKALCRSSSLLSDFCTLVLVILPHTLSYVFHKLFQLYDKGHNGVTHSQCTSLKPKVGGTLYKKKKKGKPRLLITFQIHCNVWKFFFLSVNF